MHARLPTTLLLGVFIGLSVAVAIVLALPGASSGTAWAQISPQPTPTFTPTPDPNAPTPTLTPTPANQPPLLTVDQPSLAVDEGQVAHNSGTAGDSDGDSVTLGASVGSITDNGDGTWSWVFNADDGPEQGQTVTIDATDNEGATTQTTFELSVNNVAPAITELTAPVGPVNTGVPINFTVVFTDPGVLDIHTGVVEWGDHTQCTTGGDDVNLCALDQSLGGGELRATHIFTDPTVYQVTFTVRDDDGGRDSRTVPVQVEEPDQPPVCSDASPSTNALWPPNHSFAAVNVLGVTDPDGDAVSITIDSIFQDEAVNAPGSGYTSPDGRGVGRSRAWVRAERAGGGNGRVYHISFRADDGNGGTCSGEVQVGVPHDEKDAPVDDGALYDSTAPAP